MNGLLICAGEGLKKNIGDYIQSVAQEQFYETIDCFVEREHLDTFQAKEKVNVIMNAWFMWHPENFPPSDVINPLFISFHLVPNIAERFLTPKTISYLKKYEPIGARDIGTQLLLERYGIKSYFSGCLTLTLGLKYKSKKRNEKIYFVDPYYDLIGTLEGFGKFRKLMVALGVFIKHNKSVRILKKRFNAEFMTGVYRFSKNLSDWVCCLSFYKTYSKVFSDDILLHAEYLTHSLPQSIFRNDDDKMECAKDLIKKYAEAKLVVTSRIHCALPCVGLDTPVIFVNSNKLKNGASRGGSTGRFEGLIDLMNTLYCEGYDIFATNKSMEDTIKGKITRNTIIPIPKKYLHLKDNLISQVNCWMSKNQI